MRRNPMSQPNFIFKFSAILFVTIFCYAAVFAQTDIKTPSEQSYEVVLQIVNASKTANGKTPVPASLSGVVKKLQENYTNLNYYLSATFYQRIANNGNLEFKGISVIPNQDFYAPVFSDWSFAQLVGGTDRQGANAVQIRSFRFGQRVPVRVARLKSEDDKAAPVINYEGVGLTMQKVNLPENSPTIIGNFPGSSADDLQFLILTVKQAKE